MNAHFLTEGDIETAEEEREPKLSPDLLKGKEKLNFGATEVADVCGSRYQRRGDT